MPSEGGGFLSRVRFLYLVPLVWGISAWLGVNSTFLQLPILVKDAPEGWTLPSYMVVLVQMGNLGPILYRLIQRCVKVKDAYLVYGLMCIGMCGAMVAAHFHSHTTYIFGADRSLALFGAMFLFAFLDCSSTVVFMPYMGRFVETFLISYLTGVSVGGLIPSIASLVQGAAEYGHNCASSNHTIDAELELAQPRFTVKIFYFLTLCIYLISIVAFYCLDNLELFKRQYANVTIGYGNEYTFKTVAGKEVADETATDDDKDDATAQIGMVEGDKGGEQLKKLSPANYRNLMIFATFLSFTYNAVLPAVQSYSTLPYGSSTYHFSVVFSYIMNTMAYVSTNFIKHSSLRMVFGLAAVQLVPAIYVLMTALMSPNPLFMGSTLGPVLIIISWSIAFSLFGFLNLSILSIVRGQGGRSLVRVGEFTQLGAFSGSVLSFIIINFTDTFKQYNPCES